MTAAAAPPQEAVPRVEIVKSAGEKVIVEPHFFRGKTYVSARVHFITDDEQGHEAWRPGKNGICLAPELALEVAEAMATAAKAAGGERGTA